MCITVKTINSIVLRILLLFPLLLCFCSDRENLRDQGRLIFIALDGADWDVIDPLLEEGLLPNFKSMIEQGTRADLYSLGDEWVFQPQEGKWGTSPAIWTSIATGMLPEEHGIVDFIVMDEGVTFPITSNYLAATPVWDIMGENGLVVAVAGWWATWPAKRVNGFMISDHVGISRWDLSTNYRKAGFDLYGDTYPASLIDEILPYRRSPAGVSTEEAMARCGIESNTPGLDEGRKIFELKIAIAADLTYANTCLYLMDRYDVDFVSPYIEGVDIVQHLFWKYAYPDTSLNIVQQADIDNLGSVIKSYHVFVDSLLGEFIKSAGEQDRIMIASDHGFHSSDVRSKIHISGEHDRKGILLMKGPGIKRSYLHENIDVLDLTPMILYMTDIPIARDMKGHLPLNAFTEEYRRRRKPRYVDTYQRKDDRSVNARPIPSPVDADLLEKLEALGYISREK